MTPEAERYMKGISTQYIDSGRPPPRAMEFDRGKDDVVHRELRDLGLIERRGTKGGPWVLTETGVEWVMESLDDTDSFKMPPSIL